MTKDPDTSGADVRFDPESARTFCGDLTETVDTLIDVLNEETRLIKAAKLTAAARMSDDKAQVSERYVKAHGVLKTAGPELNRLAPDEIGHLRARHQALEAAISVNLAVLATARTVSETLIRGIGETIAVHRGRTETYGANGRQSIETPGGPSPLTCNVAL